MPSTNPPSPMPSSSPGTVRLGGSCRVGVMSEAPRRRASGCRTSLRDDRRGSAWSRATQPNRDAASSQIAVAHRLARARRPLGRTVASNASGGTMADDETPDRDDTAARKAEKREAHEKDTEPSSPAEGANTDDAAEDAVLGGVPAHT